MTITQKYPLLSIFLSATILVNCLFVFFSGYGADLGYWLSWTSQLADHGYQNFNGNYPPVYLHWLYLVAKSLNYFSIPIENNDLLKFLWVFPVSIAHLIIVRLVHHLLLRFNSDVSFYKTLMLLTVFNPAILINGPVWGQIDLLPCSFAMAAIFVHFSQRFAVFMLPLFALAILTKLQMICFAPVIGILFFQKIKQHLVGILLALFVSGLVFLPFYMVDYHKQIFKQAYIDTLGQYPVITMNAANIWIWLIGNNAPDNIQILPQLHSVFPAQLAKANYFGMYLFSSICLFVVVFGFYQFNFSKMKLSEQTLMGYAFFYAMLCALAFFALLPAMHERYIFPAVIAAAFFAAARGKQMGYFALISIIATFNMLIILGINGSNIWLGLSLAVTGVLIFSFIELLAGEKFYQFVIDVFSWLFEARLAFPFVFMMGIGITLYYLVDRHMIHKINLENNEKLLTDYSVTFAHQEYSVYKINASVDGKAISVGEKRYANGIGTHANSIITFSIPHEATELNVHYGLDDEVGAAEVVFEIWEADKRLWQSEVVYGYEKAKSISVPLNGSGSLTLEVDSHGENTWDHADWIEPILKLNSVPAIN